MIYQFEAISNIRDLSDVPLPGGRRIKPHTLLRSGHLAHATPADLDRLQQMGIRAVLDFRDPVEQQKCRDTELPGAVCYHLPAFCPLDPPPGMTRQQQNEAFHKNPDKFLDYAYTYMVDGENALEAWQRMFAILLELDGAPVLWHCKQGKDRTGIAAILILTALGADPAEAERDFLLTNAVMQPHYEKILREDPANALFAERYLFVSRDRLRLFLQKAGDLQDYLIRQLGLTQEQLRQLQRAYTVE